MDNIIVSSAEAFLWQVLWNAVEFAFAVCSLVVWMWKVSVSLAVRVKATNDKKTASGLQRSVSFCQHSDGSVKRTSFIYSHNSSVTRTVQSQTPKSSKMNRVHDLDFVVDDHYHDGSSPSPRFFSSRLRRDTPVTKFFKRFSPTNKNSRISNNIHRLRTKKTKTTNDDYYLQKQQGSASEVMPIQRQVSFFEEEEDLYDSTTTDSYFKFNKDNSMKTMSMVRKAVRERAAWIARQEEKEQNESTGLQVKEAIRERTTALASPPRPPFGQLSSNAHCFSTLGPGEKGQLLQQKSATGVAPCKEGAENTSINLSVCKAPIQDKVGQKQDETPPEMRRMYQLRAKHTPQPFPGLHDQKFKTPPKFLYSRRPSSIFARTSPS